MNSIDVNAENFQAEVLDKSQSVPVVIDFWAEWCQPCQILKPILEKLAEEYDGKFILAKVDSDANQQLAAQFGVRGIPSIKAVYKGAIVNEFSGVLPEEEVRKFLDNLVPNESEVLRLDALSLLDSGEPEQALSQLDKSIALDGTNEQAKIDKAEILASQGKLESAETVINTLSTATQRDNEKIQKIKTQIDIASRSKELAAKDALLQSIEDNPADLQLKLNLANVYIAEKNYESALEQLFEIIHQDKGFSDGIARKTVLEIFTLAASQGDLVRAARKKLASLLN